MKNLGILLPAFALLLTNCAKIYGPPGNIVDESEDIITDSEFAELLEDIEKDEGDESFFENYEMLEVKCFSGSFSEFISPGDTIGTDISKSPYGGIVKWANEQFIGQEPQYIMRFEFNEPSYSLIKINNILAVRKTEPNLETGKIQYTDSFLTLNKNSERPASYMIEIITEVDNNSINVLFAHARRDFLDDKLDYLTKKIYEACITGDPSPIMPTAGLSTAVALLHDITVGSDYMFDVYMTDFNGNGIETVDGNLGSGYDANGNFDFEKYLNDFDPDIVENFFTYVLSELEMALRLGRDFQIDESLYGIK